MIYEINCGHCLSGKDTGAIGNGFKEQDLTRQIGYSVMSKLKEMEHTIIDCTVNYADSVNEALSLICSKANSIKADMFVSIHLNASDSKGHGTEIFTYGSNEIKEARNILNNIVSLGYSNRGIKDGKNLAVIKNTKAPAMLIEVCFIDNVADMKLFDIENISNAIVKGLTGEVPIKKDINLVLETQRFLNKLQITDYENKPLIEDGQTGTRTRTALNKLVLKL